MVLNVLEIASACKTDLAMTMSGFLLEFIPYSDTGQE